MFTHSKDSPAYLTEYFTHEDTDSRGVKRPKTYRFYGSSFRGEEPRQPPDSRPSSEYNMLMFIIEDVDNSENIYREAVNMFAVVKINSFKSY